MEWLPGLGDSTDVRDPFDQDKRGLSMAIETDESVSVVGNGPLDFADGGLTKVGRCVQLRLCVVLAHQS